jgi:hypothetical protein
MDDLWVMRLSPQSPEGGYYPKKLLSSEKVGFKLPEMDVIESEGNMGKIHFE